MLVNSTDLLRDITNSCARSSNTYAKELKGIFDKPYIKSILQTHDLIGSKEFDILSERQVNLLDPDSLDSPIMPGETIKMIGLRRNPKEPLGLTVEIDEHKQLIVARILAGGMIDKQGLLHPGDVILEVNGVPVSTPEQLQDQITLAKESVTLKVGPSVEEEMKSGRIMMSGGQVKNGTGRNLDSGKQMTVSTRLCFFLASYYNIYVSIKEKSLNYYSL